jgi:hypothetical protein
MILAKFGQISFKHEHKIEDFREQNFKPIAEWIHIIGAHLSHV